MKLKTTKELIKELENKSAFTFMWAIIWRFWVAYFVIMMSLFFIIGIFF